MARKKSPDGLLALYEAVCGEPARLTHARDRAGTCRRILDRLLGAIQGRFFSLAAVAYGRRMSHQAFDEWASREFGRLVGAFVEDVQARDPVGATQRFFSHLQKLKLPEHFRGRFKPPRASLLPCGDALLKEFEDLVRRGRHAMRKTNRLPALLDAFPDAPHDMLDRPGRFVPERFAKEALANRYSSSVREIASALREARKAGSTPSLS